MFESHAGVLSKVDWSRRVGAVRNALTAVRQRLVRMAGRVGNRPLIGAGVALTGALLLLASSSYPPNSPAEGGIEGAAESAAVPATSSPAVVTPGPVGNTREQEWKRILPRLAQADRESAAAINAEIAKLDAFFAERKKGAEALADEMLGLGTKLEYSLTLADRGVRNAASAIKKLCQGDNGELDIPPPPGSVDEPYLETARQMFRKRIFDDDQLTRAAEAGIAGYLGSLKAIESRLLVDIKADVESVDRVMYTAPLGTFSILATTRPADDGACPDMLAIARGDLGVMAVQEAVGWYAGNKFSDSITSGMEPGFKKTLINGYAGYKFSGALNDVVRNAGYSPESKIAGRVRKAVDEIRNMLIEGDPEAIRRFQLLRKWSSCHPDRLVREKCDKAMKTIQDRGYLGFRFCSRTLDERQARDRKRAIAEAVMGSAPVDAAATDFDRFTMPSRDRILAMAMETAGSRTFWSGDKP
jgi:hypothetical protein